MVGPNFTKFVLYKWVFRPPLQIFLVGMQWQIVVEEVGFKSCHPHIGKFVRPLSYYLLFLQTMHRCIGNMKKLYVSIWLQSMFGNGFNPISGDYSDHWFFFQSPGVLGPTLTSLMVHWFQRTRSPCNLYFLSHCVPGLFCQQQMSDRLAKTMLNALKILSLFNNYVRKKKEIRPHVKIPLFKCVYRKQKISAWRLQCFCSS